MKQDRDNPPVEDDLYAIDRVVRDICERQEAVSAREMAVDIREAALADRCDRERTLLVDADVRDVLANARDAVADRRDMAANIKRLLDGEDGDSEVLRARVDAAADRADAQGDRFASKADRAQLTSE